MTFREKFKAVFGVEFEDFSERDLDLPYGKLKQYVVTMYEVSYLDKEKDLYQVYINAKSERDARKKALVILGDKYNRYWHKIRIEENNEAYYPDTIIDIRKQQLPELRWQ